MEGPLGEEEDFVGNVGLDREPVEVDESGYDVLLGLRAGKNPGSVVLVILEPVQALLGTTNRIPLQ